LDPKDALNYSVRPEVSKGDNYNAMIMLWRLFMVRYLTMNGGFIQRFPNGDKYQASGIGRSEIRRDLLKALGKS